MLHFRSPSEAISIEVTMYFLWLLLLYHSEACIWHTHSTWGGGHHHHPDLILKLFRLTQTYFRLTYFNIHVSLLYRISIHALILWHFIRELLLGSEVTDELLAGSGECTHRYEFRSLSLTHTHPCACARTSSHPTLTLSHHTGTGTTNGKNSFRLGMSRPLSWGWEGCLSVGVTEAVRLSPRNLLSTQLPAGSLWFPFVSARLWSGHASTD